MKTAALIAIAALGVAQTASAQFDRDRGRGGATFYVKDGYGGRSVSIDRPVRSFREFDMNDKISSVAIQGGRWQVCEDDDFRGRCEVIDRSISRMDRLGMDDRISSARPIDGGFGGGRPGGGGNGGGWGGGTGNGGGWGGSRPGGPSSPLPAGSWAASCRGGAMSGGVLRAQCNGPSGWHDTRIDIRQCRSGRAGNNYGNLVCE